MKLGIIGTGIIVQEFLPKLTQLEGMEIKALQAVPQSLDQAKALAEQNGVAHVVKNLDDLAKTGIDTVYVAVPNHLHYLFCKDALEHGLNVIVEKPITGNDRQAKELKAIAEEKHLYLFEAITTVYFDTYRKIREWIREIGNIRLVTCHYSQYSRRYDAFRNGETLPAFDPLKCGGALMDLNLYNLHFVTGLFGKPESYIYYPNIERNIDTSGVLHLDYGTFRAVCTAAKDSSAPKMFVIQGTDGYITTQYSPNFIGRVTKTMNDGSVEEYDDGMAENRLIPEFRYFTECIGRNDHAACMKMLEESILVSEIQTGARIKAGILFPCDEEN